MKPLTFLDFSGLVIRTKNIETQVQVLTQANRKQEEEIEDLRYRTMNRESEIHYLEEEIKKTKTLTTEKLKQLSEKTNKTLSDSGKAYQGVLNLGRIIDVIFDELPEEIVKPLRSKIGETIKTEQLKGIETLKNQIEEAKKLNKRKIE
jgi:hypothetical protein